MDEALRSQSEPGSVYRVGAGPTGSNPIRHCDGCRKSQRPSGFHQSNGSCIQDGGRRKLGPGLALKARLCSLTTSKGLLSSLSPTNLVCLPWSAPVHARNLICATTSGAQPNKFLHFVCSEPLPHRPAANFGRLAKQHLGVCRLNSFEHLASGFKRSARPEPG
jgi:hypothetical protein